MIHDKLISYINDNDKQNKIKNQFPEEVVYAKDKKYIHFCMELAKQWILQTLCHFPSNQTDENKIRDLKIDTINKILDLLNNFDQDKERIAEDTRIYAYFLYFSGILFIIKDQNHHLDLLKKFFLKSYDKEVDNNLKHFYGYLLVYIDIVNTSVKDINVFNELQNFLKEDKYYDNVVFDAIFKEHKLMFEVIDETPQRDKLRMERLGKIFPTVEKKYDQTYARNIIKSIIKSGLALLYLVAEYYNEHEKALNDSIEKFPENSFALVQKGYLLANPKQNHTKKDQRKNAGGYRDFVGAKKIFNAVIQLIDKEHQFKNMNHFRYKIKFEAVLGLAYLDYCHGLGVSADKRYEEAGVIINAHLSKDKKDKNTKDYLQCILKINQGRNILDNNVSKHNSNARVLFEEVLEIFDNSDFEIKDELKDLATISHNNLGIYYLNEGLYEEAEEQFKKALLINNNSAHARYNLGILYYRKKEYDRALTLIRNAGHIDPEFTEAKKALEKLDTSKGRGLGTEWFDWWWSKDRETEERKKMKNIIFLKKLFLVVLFFVAIVTFGRLTYELYLQDFYDPMNKFFSIIVDSTNNLFNRVNQGNVNSTIDSITVGNTTVGNTTVGNANMGVPSHQIDENAFLVIIAMCIAITMLPFINKLKLGDVEIEVESGGSRPIAPTSITEGMPSQDSSDLKKRLFFPHFWY